MRSLFGAAVWHLIYFGAYLPYRTWAHRHVWPEAAARRPRIEHYKANTVHFLSHGVMSLLALFYLSGPVRSTLFPAAWPTLADLGLGVAACAVIVAIDLVYSRRCFDRDAPHMYLTSPQTAEERLHWGGQSAAAGITEELTWRGVQPALIAQWTGQPWLAIVICAATFGIGHVRMGNAFVPIAALFALIFHALAWLTGGLYVAMIVHVAVNVIVGFVAGRWVRTT